MILYLCRSGFSRDIAAKAAPTKNNLFLNLRGVVTCNLYSHVKDKANVFAIGVLTKISAFIKTNNVGWKSDK